MVTPHLAYRRLQDFQDRVPGHRANPRAHYSTLFRWVTRGVLAQSGVRIRLRAVKVGTKWCSTDEWFDEFIAAVTEQALSPEDAPAPRGPGARSRAAAEAGAELARLGC